MKTRRLTMAGATVEFLKQQYVEPGKQPQIVKDLAEEAIAFVEKNNLVTVPELAKETWRMEMMSPQQQLVSPFFLGGEVIQVAFPTNEMAHEANALVLGYTPALVEGRDHRGEDASEVHRAIIPVGRVAGARAARKPATRFPAGCSHAS